MSLGVIHFARKLRTNQTKAERVLETIFEALHHEEMNVRFD